MVLFVLAFVVGEGPPSFGQMTAREQLFSLGMGSLFLGLVVAWFWEGWGGLLSIAGWAFLSMLAGRVYWNLPLAIPAAVGVLHLLCWWRLRAPAPPLEPVNAATRARLRVLSISLWVSLAAFVLLCANEMFGQPPLMTRAITPPAELAGTWSANLATPSRQGISDRIPIVFTIAPDGAVSGAVGNAKLTSGHLAPNRSWFGRLMNWRTDYVIRGTLSCVVKSHGGAAGDRFSAPLNRRGAVLNGTLFLSHPGAPRPLGLNLTKR